MSELENMADGEETGRPVYDEAGAEEAMRPFAERVEEIVRGPGTREIKKLEISLMTEAELGALRNLSTPGVLREELFERGRQFADTLDHLRRGHYGQSVALGEDTNRAIADFDAETGKWLSMTSGTDYQALYGDPKPEAQRQKEALDRAREADRAFEQAMLESDEAIVKPADQRAVEQHAQETAPRMSGADREELEESLQGDHRVEKSSRKADPKHMGWKERLGLKKKGQPALPDPEEKKGPEGPDF